MRRLGIPHPGKIARLFSDWESIVGDAVARRCRPVSLREGLLKVRANSTAWAAELRYLTPELVRRVNQEMGEPLVAEVRVLVETVSSKGSKRPPGGPA
jgi:predicted nucleic acid-binding Zn ribbon protein